jgi:hypothetical protein
MPIPPYGVAIQQAIAGGSLDHMKRVAKEAETYLSEHGDVRSALEALKVEIARHEAKKK